MEKNKKRNTDQIRALRRQLKKERELNTKAIEELQSIVDSILKQLALQNDRHIKLSKINIEELDKYDLKVKVEEDGYDITIADK